VNGSYYSLSTSVVIYTACEFTYCHVLGFCSRLTRRVLNWMVGFIDTLFTQLGTTGNYRAIAILHALQFTVTHTLGFSVFTSRILTTDLQQYDCNLKITHEVFFAPPNHILAVIVDSIQFNSSAPKIMSRQAGVPNSILHSLLLS
jgi:hypothetical protein